ncbi:MAG: protein kinase [Gemmataceae bacterium]|nr:protein kinase [Gemmataceae bacterium]
MQFIDGQTLEALIRERRAPADTAPRAEPTVSLAGGVSAQDGVAAPTPPPAEPVAPTQARADTAASLAPREYYRRVAEWGIQAAEALEHAHQLGVVHRDIKPANLMLDGDGQLWVTDFGLARSAADSGLTMTGDVLGTLRYMSPEQALAKHGLVDHRTDIYTLGATLYELLTLRPAVEGESREEILRRLTLEEPAAPRRHERAIPPDLETVVLKALEKEPGSRYATAAELAADLRRFLEDRPILARRPGLAKRARKWSRRHPTLVWSVAVGVLVAVAVAGGGIGWFLSGPFHK